MEESVDDIRILVVEDDQSLLNMVTALLEAEGYTVEGSPDGETAIKLAQKTAYDLVITDVKLGALDGLDTLSELKKTESTFQSLVMTGYSTEADTIRALKLGVGNYLKKPFSMDDFLLAVQEQVRRAVLERKVQSRELAALRTLSWALEAILETHGKDEEGVLGISQAILLAERTALALSLPHRTVSAIRSLTLLRGLQQSGFVPSEDDGFSGFPEPIPNMLRELQTKNFADSSPRTQVVSLALASSTLEEDTESLSGELKEQFPSISEEMAQALDSAYRDEVVPSLHQTQGNRSLLSLASALQARGDRDGAALALSRLESKRLTSETLMARLLEARLQWESNQTKEAASKINSVVEEAEPLGKRVMGQASLEGGLLLAEMGEEQAKDLLASAKALLQKEGSRKQIALADLGLLLTGETDVDYQKSLQELLQARHLESFLRAGPWLLPLLLQLESQDGKSEVVRASRRLIRDLPELLNAQIKKGLPLESLMSALKGISAVGRSGHEETLNWLLKSSEHAEIKRAAEKLLGTEAKEKEAFPPVLRIYLSGGFETWFGNHLLRWSGTKYQYLLSFICSSASTIVPIEGLLEKFWPDHGKRAQRCFSQAISSIRKTLQPPNWEQKLSYLERSSDGIHLNSKLPIWCDVTEIRKALTEARELERGGDWPEAASAIRRANEAYRGPFLAGCYMDWALSRREKLVASLNEATLKLAGRSLEANHNYEALDDAEKVLTRDPVNEQAQGIKMSAMTKTGRTAEAIRSFEAFSRNLQHEIGVEPSTELLKAYHLAKMSE